MLRGFGGLRGLVLPDGLERRLRKAVFQGKGMKKGNLEEAFSEAVVLWIESGKG